jgi:antitoxin (DNA-binding transcriptional repressor) of toxin-antitoxin stability system
MSPCDTFGVMGEVTPCDLRNHGGDVVDRLLRGESLTVTRGGRPVAELRPLSRPGLAAADLLQRWRQLTAVDPDRAP